jgi:hypothetical protein
MKKTKSDDATPDAVPESGVLHKAIASVARVQDFPVESLPRLEELGRTFSFEESLAPAKRLVRLIQQIPVDHLHDLPDEQLDLVKQQADALYKSFSDILEFDPGSVENATSQKQSLISTLSNSYQSYFNNLLPIISYLRSRIHDFSALESDGKAAVQALRDEAEQISSQLKEHAETAQEVLSNIRKTAAEQGVSQHAVYFKDEADEHETQANIWRGYTIGAMAVFVALALASLYLHHVPGLQSGAMYQAGQIAISKLIVFAILGYLVVLCARNFLAHRHNSVVNRHRQNALLTFKALADAAGSEEKRDIVLAHAASCIKTSSGGSSSNSATALMPYMFREASSS